MASGITIKLELQPMYADYVTKVMHADEKGQLFLSEKTELGILVKSLVAKLPINISNNEPKDGVICILPDWRDKRNEIYNYLSDNSREIIASWIRERFFFDLHNHIIKLNQSGARQIKRSILLFTEIYEIHPDNFNYGSLKKEYYRFRGKRIPEETKNIALMFSGLLSLLCHQDATILPPFS